MSDKFQQPPLTAGDKRFVPIVVSISGAVVDITDWTITFAMWSSDGVVNVQRDATITDAIAGECGVVILPADTSGVTTQTRCSVEIQAMLPGGDGPYTVLRDERWIVYPQRIVP